MGVLSAEQYQRAAKAEKRRVRVDGVSFKNRRQADMFLELKALERAGKISDLKPHARFPLVVTGLRGKELVDTYTATFSYTRDGETVLVDTDWETDVRRLQKRLVEVLLGLEVQDAVC